MIDVVGLVVVGRRLSLYSAFAILTMTAFTSCRLLRVTSSIPTAHNNHSDTYVLVTRGHQGIEIVRRVDSHAEL